MKWKISRKWLVISGLASIVATPSNAQGIRQWFSQKSTQTEYLIQQIAALKMYGGYLKKGYDVVKGGLNTIGDIKDGHFKLDRIFMDSLKLVSGAVKRDARVKEIIRLQKETATSISACLKMVRKSDYFYPADLEYISGVLNHIGERSNGHITELENILRNGNYQMSDDQRIKRVQWIYQEIKEQFAFVGQFAAELKKLEIQRSRELRDVRVIDKLY